MHSFSWTDIEDIAIALAEQHPGMNPLEVRFTQMRMLVEKLDGFEPQPGQKVNEQILEAIQVSWHEERQDLAQDEDDDERHYTPNNPFRG